MLCEAWTLVDVYSPVTSKPSKKVLVEIVTEIHKEERKETSINTIRITRYISNVLDIVKTIFTQINKSFLCYRWLVFS